MKWESCTPSALKTILSRAVEETEGNLEKCYDIQASAIRCTLGKIALLMDKLETKSGADMALAVGTAQDLITEIYTAYRQSIYALVLRTSAPFTASGILSAREEKHRTIETLDKCADGIYVFRDGNKIRVRTPPVPTKKASEVYALNSTGGVYKVQVSNIYGESVYRAFEEFMLTEKHAADLGKKLIHVLNVFKKTTQAPDNDNRDITGIINSICAFLPGGDTARTTAFLLDGYETDIIPEGTYFTVSAFEGGIPSSEETVSFWKQKLAEERMKWPLPFTN